MSDAHDNVSFGDKIAGRRQERAEKAMTPEQREIQNLYRLVNELMQWKNNLKGRNGIKVEDGEIVLQAQQQDRPITATAVCNGDGTITITVHN